MTQSSIESQIRQSGETIISLAKQRDKIEEIISILQRTIAQGGCIYSCGNGGSTADAIHLTEELVARYLRERPGIRAQHLCDPAVLTCWANDYDFESVFERQVKTHLTPKDTLIAFTTSGKSKNVLRALEAANSIGAATIGLLGKDGGKAKTLAKTTLIVESDNTARIQEAHMTLVHIICDELELRLFPDAK